MVANELKRLKEQLNSQELKLQQEITNMKKEAGAADAGRLKALEELKRLKMKLKDQQMTEDVRHNYVYHILFNNWKKREGTLRSEVPAGENNFPRYDRITFRLPEHLNIDELKGTSKGLIGHIDVLDGHWKFPSVDDVARRDLDVDFFDIDRLNAVNSKRIAEIDAAEKKPGTPDLDELDKKLFDFLDQEQSLRLRPAGPMSGLEANKELLNQDILREYDTITTEPFLEPVRAYSRAEKRLTRSKSQTRYNPDDPDF